MRSKIPDDVHRVVSQDEGRGPDSLRGAGREDYSDARPLGSNDKVCCSCLPIDFSMTFLNNDAHLILLSTF